MSGIGENAKVSGQTENATSSAKEKRPKSNWAQILSAVAAIVALVVVVTQVQIIKNNSRDAAVQNRESAARQMFRSHLELELNNPKLVVQDFLKIENADDVEKIPYIVFVTHLLYTCEELISTIVNDYGWRKTCEMRLQVHAPYLCSAPFDQAVDTYHPILQNLIRSIRRDSGNNGIAGCERWKGRT